MQNWLNCLFTDRSEVFSEAFVFYGCLILRNCLFIISHNHRLSRWLAQPYKGMLLAGLKAHRNI